MDFLPAQKVLVGLNQVKHIFMRPNLGRIKDILHPVEAGQEFCIGTCKVFIRIAMPPEQIIVQLNIWTHVGVGVGNGDDIVLPLGELLNAQGIDGWSPHR